MASEIVAVDYEVMRNIQQEFDQECDRCQRVSNQVKQQVEVLRGGAWISDSADSFYREMDDEVMIAMNRLVQALSKAAQVTDNIMKVMEAAEEEASNMVPNEF